MWRQSSVWKWVAGGLHMISVCVLAALIIAFIVLNSGGQNYWKQIIEDSNGGKDTRTAGFFPIPSAMHCQVFFRMWSWEKNCTISFIPKSF